MRGEFIESYDGEGNPVYNTPPSNAAGLLSAVQDEFADDFTPIQVEAILTKMVEYSKYDGTGNWTFYKNNVIL